MDDRQGVSLIEAARESYLTVATCELPRSGTGVETWIPAMKAVSRLNSMAVHPALVSIADQLEAGFHDAIGTGDPTRLHVAFDAASRRLRRHAGAA